MNQSQTCVEPIKTPRKQKSLIKGHESVGYLATAWPTVRALKPQHFRGLIVMIIAALGAMGCSTRQSRTFDEASYRNMERKIERMTALYEEKVPQNAPSAP
jgi:hypothetical protein